MTVGIDIEDKRKEGRVTTTEIIAMSIFEQEGEIVYDVGFIYDIIGQN